MTVHEWIAETDLVVLIPGFRVDTCPQKTLLLAESSPVRPELHKIPLPFPNGPITSIVHTSKVHLDQLTCKGGRQDASHCALLHGLLCFCDLVGLVGLVE